MIEEAALSGDVRLLGELLGEILREQEGPAHAALLEQVLSVATRARSGSAHDAQALRELLASLDTEKALPLARAFAHFLALANIAEQHHRVRLRRQKRVAFRGENGTFEGLARLRADGVSARQLQDALAGLQVGLVLTAHPTQMMRRTLLQKHRRIAAALAKRDRSDLLPDERSEIIEALRREILALWQSDELRRTKLSPVDEARAGLVLFDQILWDALPTYLGELDHALLQTTGQRLPLDAAPLRFGTWMGGDRDGNPNVTAEVTEEVCLLARWEAAELYYREVEALHDELSMTRASDALRARVGAEAQEPYRNVLRQVLARLGATRRHCEPRLLQLSADDAHVPMLRSAERPARMVTDAAPYTKLEELWEPLALCHASLCEVGAAEIANGRLLDVLRRVAGFGLSLSRLDIRQESGVHALALDAITKALGLGSYLAWPEPERIAFLVRELDSARPLLPRELPDDAALAELLNTLKVCARQPAGVLGAYVISMAKAASDVLAVQLLQREASVNPPLPVVPLFETLADLDRAGEVMASLFEIASYRERIAGHQEVMIGYSDSTKDVGRVAAAWALFRAQEDVVRTARAHGVRLTLFHGRGGTIGRGGGPIYLSILSQPPGSVDGRLRVTIQGETMEVLFGLPDVAVESFELYVNATLDATLRPPPGPSASQRALMDRLSSLAASAFRRVVTDPDFLRYFEVATPLSELSRLNIGSRPARRNNGAPTLGSLRAIPWIFAWTQTRLHLPAWLGTGEALEALYEEGKEQSIRELARDWPFFRSLLELFEMILAKADTDIAAYYDRALVPDDLHPLGERLRESCRNTIAAVLRARGERELLENQHELRRSIELRNPYVDPLNVLQAELLRRARASDDPRIWDALLVTVNGIAAGMRNTG